MFYTFLSPLSDDIGVFNLFRYITLRTGGALITALLISFIFGPKIINWLKNQQGGASNIREDVPEQHLQKAGTPSMGGLLILIAITFSTLLWADWGNQFIWGVFFLTLSFGFIGFADDYLKVRQKNSKGLRGKVKLSLQTMAAIIGVWIIQQGMSDGLMYHLTLPFFKNILIYFGPFFILFMVFVVIGTSNAVNLTDGLDGLAIVPVMICASSFGVISYVVGNVIYANYLQLNYVAGTGELAVFAGSILGAGLGFLWFNAPPARVFMGDTGSLSLGAALGGIAVASKHEIVLMIIGGLFVLEAVSVIVQVASFKLTGKRVFAMAPLHHHFEKKGWAESTIVIRFWIIAVILALIGLATLKLR